MIALFVIRVVNSVLMAILGLVDLPVAGIEGGGVVSVPYIQDSLDFFSSTIHGVISIFPMLDVIYTLFIFAIGIKVLQFTYQLIMQLIGLIRG